VVGGLRHRREKVHQTKTGWNSPLKGKRKERERQSFTFRLPMREAGGASYNYRKRGARTTLRLHGGRDTYTTEFEKERNASQALSQKGCKHGSASQTEVADATR